MTKTVAIIGGGVIGGGWAARFLLNGWNVNLFDPDPASTRKIDEVMANARYALPMLYDKALPDEGSLTRFDSIAEAVKGVDWIQESVPERLDIKHKVFAEIEVNAPRDTPIGSSTSGFKPSELAEGMQTADRLMVAHPFNPVYLLPLIELVPSDQTSEAAIARASEILTSVGHHALRVRKEIDAHIADRFLEAVWREALWLIKDGVASTEEIDNAIRYGFGLRWAQMGLFETYRVAGGEAGMRHFIEQFGPCLKWPWTKLMDVPELTDELIDTIADQSDDQSGMHTIRELERMRDENLVGILRSLKTRNAGAGALLTEHEATLTTAPTAPSAQPVVTMTRTVPVDWTDRNGHMNESRYGQVFSDAIQAFMTHIGADPDYVANGHSYFTVDIRIRFMRESHAGDAFSVESRILMAEGKKLRMYHEMRAPDGTIIATGDQFLLHVNLETRQTCEPLPEVRAQLEAMASAHAQIPQPEGV